MDAIPSFPSAIVVLAGTVVPAAAAVVTVVVASVAAVVTAAAVVDGAAGAGAAVGELAPFGCAEPEGIGAIAMLLQLGQLIVSVQLSHITLIVACFPFTWIGSSDSLSLSESKKMEKMSS